MRYKKKVDAGILPFEKKGTKTLIYLYNLTFNI